VTKFCQSLIALLFLIASSSAGFSQIATTSLRGTVTDPSGASVPSATITLTDNSTGKLLQTKSNSVGGYIFNQIPPSKYAINAAATGFGDQRKSAELLVNQPATVDFSMSIQATGEIVNVSTETQTVNTTDASLGTAFNDARIQSLPS